jgi:peptidoglycan/xylan/chitin deacetylase (PgdA/CDA1 family)
MQKLILRANNFKKKVLASLLYKSIARLTTNRPLLSFTFDDFPRSSYTNGGTILNNFGFKATYYVSLGLMGKELPVGPAFINEDIEKLMKDGHELGCHTYDHLDAWDTIPYKFSESTKKIRHYLKNYILVQN